MSSSKKLACKGTLRQAFIRVYRLEIVNFSRTVHSVMLVFSTQLCDLYSPLLPQPLSPWFNSPFPSLWVSGPQTDKHLPESSFTGKYFQFMTFCIAFYCMYSCLYIVQQVSFSLFRYYFASVTSPCDWHRYLPLSCARIYRPSFHENKPKTLVSLIQTERFGLIFAKTGSTISGTVQLV